MVTESLAVVLSFNMQTLTPRGEWAVVGSCYGNRKSMDSCNHRFSKRISDVLSVF